MLKQKDVCGLVKLYTDVMRALVSMISYDNEFEHPKKGRILKSKPAKG